MLCWSSDTIINDNIVTVSSTVCNKIFDFGRAKKICTIRTLMVGEVLEQHLGNKERKENSWRTTALGMMKHRSAR